ncbi:MAG: cation:proton antiporter subunit C [Candidatus Methanofastidiosa archaeon]|nr:cation:proton antiporter subunit C [Candidatus Methanofastidiosa archaeon]
MEPFQVGAFLTAGILVVTGLWAIIMMDNILKKVIGANLVGDGVNLVLIGIGYRPGGLVPEVTHHFHASAVPSSFSHFLAFNEFADLASYPLPFALVLTNIVIGASTFYVMLALSVVLYHKYHTLSVHKIFEGMEED